jgi:hypothetical protein
LISRTIRAGQSAGVRAAALRYYRQPRRSTIIRPPAEVNVSAAALAALEFLRMAKELSSLGHELQHATERHDPVIETTHSAVGVLELVVLAYLLLRLVAHGPRPQ